MRMVTVRGIDIPAIGLGTWQMTGQECRTAVRTALDLGYRHFDTAQLYNNEREVGEAIENSTVDREDIFLVTKILRRNLAFDDVIRSVTASLDRLGTHIDLLLIHAPSRSVPTQESIEAMNRLQSEGSVQHIGVSNFSVRQLETAITASETPIITNQVEYHPFKRQDDLLEFCIDNEVMLTAYSPIARGKVIGNDTLRKIGQKYGKTEVQISLRWLFQQESVTAIPKSSDRAHQRENIDIFDFELSTDDMNQIFEIRGDLVSRLRRRLGL